MDPKMIQTELDASMQRLTDAAVIDQKRELLGNLYPLLKLVVQSLASLKEDLYERVELAEDALAEVIAGSESRIQPRLAKRIHMALNIGQDLVTTLAAMHADQEQFKDFQLTDNLLTIMSAYQQATMTAQGMVIDVTIEVVNEEDIEDDEEETSDGD
jgi:cytochrome P450